MMRPYRLCNYTSSLEVYLLRTLSYVPFSVVHRKAVLCACRKALEKNYGSYFFTTQVMSPERIQLTVPSGTISDGRFFFDNDLVIPGSRVKNSNVHLIMQQLVKSDLKVTDNLIGYCYDKFIGGKGSWKCKGSFGKEKLTTKADMRKYIQYCLKMILAIKNCDSISKIPAVPIALGKNKEILRLGDGRHRISAHQVLQVPLNAYVCHVHESLLYEYGNIESLMDGVKKICEER